MINPEINYVPKGEMCRVCVKFSADCSHLPFKEMPPISKGDSDGVVIVRCNEFNREGSSEIN